MNAKRFTQLLFSRRRRPGAPTGRRRCLVALSAAISTIVVLAPAPSAEAATSGVLDLSPGRSASASVGGSFADGTGSISYVIPSSAARPLYLSLQFRSQSNDLGYRTRATILADGTVLTGFSRVRDGAETILRSEATSVQVRAGQTLRLEGSINTGTGADLAVRAWVEGTSRPDWQERLTDSSTQRIDGAGSVRAWAYLSSGADDSVSVSFDDATATAESSTVSTSTTKPSDATTGVPAGTDLTVRYGDITVTQDGAVLDRLDVRGFIRVKADNVRITNSIIRGGIATFNQGLITNYGYPGLVIENVDLVAQYPSVYVDGIKGNNFTARRVHVVGNVDSIKIHGDNVTVQNSLLENTKWYASDPNQGGDPTHNDNIQILYGRNLSIVNNTIRGATNFAILGAASLGTTPNLSIRGNWVDGGHCTIKLQELNGWSLTATAVDNKFGPNRVVKSCAFQATPGVNLTASGNVYEADGTPVTILRIES